MKDVSSEGHRVRGSRRARVNVARASLGLALLAGYGLRAEAAPTPGTQPAAAEPRRGALPRFKQLWMREGLGRFEGASAGAVHYVLGNDGRSVEALDVVTGRTSWRTPLPTAEVAEWVQMRVVAGAILIAYRRGETAEAVVTQLRAQDGAVGWSRVISCRFRRVEAADRRLFLLCETTPAAPEMDLVEVDPGTGTERARVRLEEPAVFLPNGDVCWAEPRSTVCARIGRRRIQRLWKQPAAGARFDRVRATADFVLRKQGKRLQVLRARDGRPVWDREGVTDFGLHPRTGRLFLETGDSVEVVMLEDGRSVGRLPFSSGGLSAFLADEERTLILPNDSDRPPCLVDALSRGRMLDRNVRHPHALVAGVLLSRAGSAYGLDEGARLVAWSTTEFGLPSDALDPYGQLVAVIDRFPHSWQVSTALPVLRQIPGAMESLARVISSEPAERKLVAIAAAERTGDARFLAPLRELLGTLSLTPTTGTGRVMLADTVEALAALETPEAASALVSFWERSAARISPPRLRTVVRDAVAAVVWRFGARQDWVSCKDSVFPVAPGAPERAVLGTGNPAVAYAADGEGRWAVVCEARSDDDGDGKVEVWIGQHGDPHRDELRPYLVLGSGPGTEIDDFVAADPSGRTLVITKNFCMHMVDAQTGRTRVLPRGDGRPGDPVAGAHRGAHFSPDGKSLLYFRSDGTRSTVVKRELGPGTERPIDPGPGLLAGAFFEDTGRFVVLEMVTGDTDGDGAVRAPRVAATLSRRRCRGPVASASFFGHVNDRPILRVAPVAGGPARDAPAGEALQPAPAPPARYELASDPESLLPRTLPRGPLRFRRASAAP